MAFLQLEKLEFIIVDVSFGMMVALKQIGLGKLFNISPHSHGHYFVYRS